MIEILPSPVNLKFRFSTRRKRHVSLVHAVSKAGENNVARSAARFGHLTGLIIVGANGYHFSQITSCLLNNTKDKPDLALYRGSRNAGCPFHKGQ